MNNSGDEVETRYAVNSWRRECALIMPQVDRMLSRLIAVAPMVASTGSESRACDSAVKKTRDAVMISVEAVKKARSCIDKALKFADLQIEEDPVALPDGIDGTLAEVVHGHTHRLPDSEVLSLYEKLKRRSRNLELAIEGGLPDPEHVGGVRDPLPDLEHADEAYTPITLLTNGDNVEPFDANHVIDIPSSPESDAEEVAAWEAHFTNNESSFKVLVKEVANGGTPVTTETLSPDRYVEEAVNGETPVTSETLSPEGCVEVATNGETPVTTETLSPEGCVEEAVNGETPVTSETLSSEGCVEVATNGETPVTTETFSSDGCVEEDTNGKTPVTTETLSTEGCVEKATNGDTHLTNNIPSSEGCMEKVVTGETPMTKNASSPKVMRYNLRKRVSSARTYEWDDSLLEENEGRRCAKRRKRRKWSEYEEETLMAAVQSVGSGSWKVIFNLYRDIFVNRTAVDLKDKWRGIERGK